MSKSGLAAPAGSTFLTSQSFSFHSSQFLPTHLHPSTPPHESLEFGVVTPTPLCGMLSQLPAVCSLAAGGDEMKTDALDRDLG